MYYYLHVLFDPFIHYGFMRRAIVACVALSISTTLMGAFLMLRRMSLMGDALSHAILPGIAIGYFFSGLSFVAMSIGGFISGLIIAVLSDWISEKTLLKRDASFSGFYLGSLSFGVIMISLHEGSNVDLELFDLLFGSVFSINTFSLWYIGSVSSITLLIIALLYRGFVIQTFDPDFLKGSNLKSPRLVQITFLFIVVLNLIASFHITGTLMSVGLMMLPGLSARCWVNSLTGVLLLSICIALLSSWIGLLSAFYISIPAGSAIVAFGSIVFIISVFFGRNKGIFNIYFASRFN